MIHNLSTLYNHFLANVVLSISCRNKGEVYLKQGSGKNEEQTKKVAFEGQKIVKAGTILSSNDAQAKGILLEDVDVTAGDGFGTDFLICASSEIK